MIIHVKIVIGKPYIHNLTNTHTDNHTHLQRLTDTQRQSKTFTHTHRHSHTKKKLINIYRLLKSLKDTHRHT